MEWVECAVRKDWWLSLGHLSLEDGCGRNSNNKKITSWG